MSQDESSSSEDDLASDIEWIHGDESGQAAIDSEASYATETLQIRWYSGWLAERQVCHSQSQIMQTGIDVILATFPH